MPPTVSGLSLSISNNLRQTPKANLIETVAQGDPLPCYSRLFQVYVESSPHRWGSGNEPKIDHPNVKVKDL